MPNIGTLDSTLRLDTRAAEAKLKSLQTNLSRGLGRNNPFSRLASDTRDFEKTLGAATNRVVAFGAAAVVFNTLSRSVGAFVNSLVEVDKSLAEINVNLNQSASGLKQFGAELFNVSRQTGQTFEVAAKAAAELARQGLSAEETIKRLRDSLILARLSGLDSASAVETLTAAINSFNKEALTSTEVVNKFAAVDTKFAVSSRDLADAVSRVGSTAQSAGVGINELISLVTSLQQTTARGGATIGNGLKTIFTRIQAAPETVNALQSVGVAIKDTEGNLRSAIDILRDYARAREGLGEAERAGLDRTVAGTFQINILKAALGDLSKEYSIYDSALRTSANATDEAIRKNEQLNKTLSSLINSTAVSIKQLVASIGEQDLSPALKGLFQFVETARRYLSGESGEKAGEALGNGLLKGITNVLSGPVAAGVGLVLFSAFRKILSTIAQEARGLFQINSAVQARARIQERIIVLQQNATKEEYAQLAAARSVAAQKEILLGIQARLNRELLVGTELQNAFLAPGRLGVGVRPSAGFGRGNVGAFADPIASAIQREANISGLPKSQIYVDKDPRVATFANPAGVLVANRRDEPLGGYQGVNRVIAQGGNPKLGSVPTFANPLTGRDIPFVPSATIDSINRLLGSLKGLDRNRIRGVAEELKGLTQDLNRQAQKDVRQRVLAAYSAAARQEGKIISDTSRQATPQSLSGALDAGNIAAAQILASRRGGTLVERGGSAAARAYNEQLARRNPIPRNLIPQPALGPSLVGDDLISRAIDYDVNVSPAMRRQAAQRRLNRMLRERALRQTREQQVAVTQQQRTDRRRNVAFGGALALPFAAGFVEPAFQGLGVDTRGGTGGGIASGFLRGAGQGATAGILGPVAGAIGAVGGGIIGALSKLQKSTEELAAEFEDAAAQRNKENDALNRSIAIQNRLNEARKEGADEAVISRLETQLRDSRSGIFSGRRREVLDIKDSTAQQQAVDRIAREDERQAAQDQIKLLLRGGRSEDIARQIAIAIEDADINLTDDTLAKIAGADFRAAGPAVSFGIGAAPSKQLLEEQQRAARLFEEAADKLAPFVKGLGINRSDITRQNINQLALGVYQGTGLRSENRERSRIEREASKAAAATQGLNPSAFTSAPNLDIFRQAALTGRGRPSRSQQAKSTFDLFSELIGTGATTEGAVAGNQLYAKSKATVQSTNVGDALISYLQGRGFATSGLRNNQGEPNLELIKRTLNLAGRGRGEQAELSRYLAGYASAGQNTLKNAGVSDGTYRLASTGGRGDPNKFINESNVNDIIRERGGPDYGAIFKQAEATTTKLLDAASNTVIRTALSVDGTIKVTSDTLAAPDLDSLAQSLTAAIGKPFEAQIRNINIRIANLEGKPLPPTATLVTSDSVDSSKGPAIRRGADGFYRSN